MSKFRNKYRVESHRMPGWNYAGNGMYYLTVVTQNRVCLFGKIENGKMKLSEFGKIADSEWYKSFEIRTELFSDDFVLMPNHLHAIVILKNIDDCEETHGRVVEAHGRAPLHAHNANVGDQINDKNRKNKLYRKPKSISSFMAGYKSAVTTRINNWIDNNSPKEKYNRTNRLWQVNYHDRVIRNQEEYLRIKNYIRNNPKDWKSDGFNN